MKEMLLCYSHKWHHYPEYKKFVVLLKEILIMMIKRVMIVVIMMVRLMMISDSEL